jgi:hypothetical protein
MAYTYEIILAPSEELSKFGASKLGLSIEGAIASDYLHATGASILPGGVGPITDFFDTGVQGDYIKMLVERHAPDINERVLRADSRKQGALPVPDISTYLGRFLPPRILAVDDKGRRTEDRSRNEYYEIKPNSDTGERDGRDKLEKIPDSYKRYGLSQVYKAGTIYPAASPTYIPLTWNEAFEYLRLVFMVSHNLRQCDIDLQLIQRPDAPGLLLYALRIRLGLDTELLKAEARVLAAGICVAFAACAAAGALELAAGIVGAAVAESLLEAAKHLEGQLEPEPRFRYAPQHPRGPRIDPSVKPEFETPEPLPELELEPDDERTLQNELLPPWQKGLAAAVLGRGFLLPRKKLDVYCDEDFFQNIVFDDSVARRFVSMTRLALPLSPTITVANAYLRIAVPPFIAIETLFEQIEKRLPNALRLSIGERIPGALRRMIGSPEPGRVTIVSQVLIQTPLMAAFIDPSLRANAGKRVARAGEGLGRGKIALPPEILARWKGRDARLGAPARPPTVDGMVESLLAGDPDQRNRKHLKDALAGGAMLKFALNANPGFTLGIGVHLLYAAPTRTVTPETRYGTLMAVNLSRLFGVTVKDGAGPPAEIYQNAKPSTTAEELLQNGSESFRYVGRMRVKG